ncbi:MAG: RNA methyltransferase [Acidobacteriota bacterium]|nr:RNA methyltransferase [Acidobacteriota bacterium]
MHSLADKLARVRVVLVEPTYDGNLGKVARAMRNFGLTRLVLVGGRADPTSDEARWYARAEGMAVLGGCCRTKTLVEAIRGCRTVLGTSRRLGRKRGEPQSPESVLAETAPWRAAWDTAIVFGREAHGLSTGELDLCQKLIWIPSDPECPSLNLSHAVSITAYVLAKLAREDTGDAPAGAPLEPAPAEQMEAMYEHARRVWLRIGYLLHQNPDAILRRWRRILARARLTEYDVRVVRALLHQTDWVAGVAEIPPGGPHDAPPGLFDKHARRDTSAADPVEEDEPRKRPVRPDGGGC